MDIKYKTSYYKFFIEENPKIQRKKSPLISTKDQVKLFPYWMTDKFKDEQYLIKLIDWYNDNYDEINYLFNRFIRIFKNKKIYFIENTKTVHSSFVQFLYYKNNKEYGKYIPKVTRTLY